MGIVKTANSRARGFVQTLTEFEASNTYGVWYADSYENARYVVYSYGTHWPMFIFDGEKWYENGDRASKTTSKHKNQLHPLCETEIRAVDDMCEIANRGVADWMRRKLEN